MEKFVPHRKDCGSTLPLGDRERERERERERKKLGGAV
jgi:hypothetical protein